MRTLRASLVRLLSLMRTSVGGGAPHEFDDELDSHLAMHIEDNVRRGMTPEAARRDAIIKLGGLEQTKERYRDRGSVPGVEHLMRDVRFAARTLRRNPGFTIVAVLTLALGIGANTAIFSVVNAVLLRPLPFAHADRLVLIWATNTKSGDTTDVASYPDFEDWRRQSRSFDAMAAFTTRGMTIAGADGAEPVAAVQVTPGFFEALGVSPALGRTFRSAEGDIGATHVALLTDSAWKRRFGGRADVVGETIRLNEEPYTIVGVMPPTFRYSPSKPEEIYVPLTRDPSRSHGFLRVVGRLRPDVRISAAQAEMDLISRRIAAEFPKTNQAVGVNIVPLVNALAGPVRIGLLIFLGVVAIVLVIACTNVANLMLARNATRQKEMALRTALGAGRLRLMQQLLTESTLLALAGGALGLLLATWGTQLLVALLTKNVQIIPRIENTHADGWVLGFTLALSLATGIVFGVVPALTAASPDLNESLREASRTATAGVGGRRLRNTLVVAETALALVLLAGAGLLLKGLLVMRTTAPGFGTENVLTVEFSLPKRLATLPGSGSLDGAVVMTERVRFFETLVDRVGTVPGVRSAALVADLPLGGGQDSLGFQIPGRQPPPPRKYFTAAFNIISPDYFKTMTIPVHVGRDFTHQDVMNTPGVIVVNDTAARRFWPGDQTVGKQILLPGPNNTNLTLTVIGVVGDVRQAGLGIEPRPEIFLSYLQPAPPWPWLTLVVQTTSEPMTLAAAIRSAARSVDRDVPLVNARTMDEVLSGSLAEPRVYTWLLAVFAALALALAAVGLYGVVSYTVTQRTHELGIRMALGADRGGIVRLVLGRGLRLTVIGTAIGAAGALGLMRLLTKLMPSVQPTDPVTLSGAAVLLIAVALMASLVPALRAARVDPMVALRDE